MRTAKLLFYAAFLAIGLASSRQPADGQVAVWFRERFESNAPSYGFAYTYPEDGNFRRAHLPTGGYDGGGAAHLRTLAGRTQYGFGWGTPALPVAFRVGDGVYIRFRIRYDDDHRWAGEDAIENKFILMGETRGEVNSRVIVQSRGPSPSRGCSLGFTNYNAQPPQVFWLPRDFGLPYATWSDPAIATRYGSLSPHVNISWDCAPPVLVTSGQWYHVQVYAKSGVNNDAQFKVWINNNNYSAPNSQRIGGFNLGVERWSDGLHIGGYQTDAPSLDGGFRIDDLEVGPTFHSSYSPASVSPPTPPSDLRIIR